VPKERRGKGKCLTFFRCLGINGLIVAFKSDTGRNSICNYFNYAQADLSVWTNGDGIINALDIYCVRCAAVTSANLKPPGKSILEKLLKKKDLKIILIKET